jgi:hypothetical protein
MFIAKKYRMLIICLILIVCVVGIFYYFMYSANMKPLIQEGITDVNNANFPASYTFGNTVYQKAGCWADDPIVPAIDENVTSQLTNRTLQGCVEYANTQGKNTAGWQQQGGKCFIGNNDPTSLITNYTRYGRASASVGCTGPNVNLVYTTTPATEPVSYGPADNPYNTYAYQGCWYNSPNARNVTAVTDASLNATTGDTLMAKCINYSKTNPGLTGNTAFLSGNKCYIGTIGAGQTFQNYFNLVTMPSATTTNYCSVTGTFGPTPTTASYMAYSSFVDTPTGYIGNYIYRGCYNTGSTGPLPDRLSDGGDMTLTMEQCVGVGSRNNYYTVALTNGGECWGGNKGVQYLQDNYTKYGPSDTACDPLTPAAGKLIVYSTLNDPVDIDINGYRYGGCWNDPNNDILPTRLSTTVSGSTDRDYTMTLEQCIAAARSGSYNSVAYKKDGNCYAGNQNGNTINYKKDGEIINNNPKCDIRNPGEETGIVYTTYGRAFETPIDGTDYKGCFRTGTGSFGNIMTGVYTLNDCIDNVKDSRVYDTAVFQNQNQCVVGDSNLLIDNYARFGGATGCNQYYPIVGSSVVYSRGSAPNPDITDIQYFIDQVGDYYHPASITTTNPSNTFLLKGYWNESPGNNRAVPEYLGTVSGIEECIRRANSYTYETASFQNGNQCYGGGTGTNYKRYGQATTSSVANGYTIAEIYHVGAEPTPHPDCGVSLDGFTTLDDPNTQNSNIPQPPYNTPQTTTVVFDPLPNTYTTITYAQTPNPVASTAGGGAGAATSASASASTTPPSGTSTSTATSPTTGQPLSDAEKQQTASQWLPHTPFVYENKMASSNSNSMQSVDNYNYSPPTTDIINNQYGTPTDPTVEPFSMFAKSVGSFFKEGVESLSPPSSEIPGLYVQKTQIVPPVCPAVTPVLIKPSCGSSDKSKEQSQKNERPTMCLNNFITENSLYGPSPSQYTNGCSSGSNYGGNTDNIPQPYLPSFSGFGM